MPRSLGCNLRYCSTRKASSISLHSLIVALAAIVGTIAGFCYFIDKISTTEFKAHVVKMLTGHADALGKVTIAEHVQRYIAGTVGNFFGGEFLSWRNVGRSFALTLLALLIIVPATCLLNQTSPVEVLTIWGDFDSRANLFAIAFLVAACFTIDMVSFLQTAMFMRLTAYVPRFRDMAAMAFFDIVVTLNLFTMLFAAFCVPVLAVLDSRGVVAEINVAAYAPIKKDDRSAERPENAAQRALQDKGLDLWELWYRAKPPGAEKWSGTGTGFIALKGYSAEDVLEKFFQAERASNIKAIPRASSSETAPIFSANIHMHDKLRRLGVFLRYSVIYQISHVVQDQFAGLLRLQLLSIDLTKSLSLHSDYAATPLRYDAAYFSVCDGRIRYEHSAGTNPDCEKFGLLEIRRPFLRLYDSFVLYSDDLRPMPVTIIAASSLFLTLGFYIGLAIYTAIALASRYARRLMLSEKIFDLNGAPLTVGAIYGMLCLIPPTILVMLVIMYS